MPERPILRLPDPTDARRKKRKKGSGPTAPTGPTRQRQGQRFQATFDRLVAAMASENPAFQLRQDPTGIAPERALVFVTAGEIQGFVKVARKAGLEVFGELQLEELADIEDGFAPPAGKKVLKPALYTTMPTVAAFGNLLRLWRAYQNDEKAPIGSGPWWKVFDLLRELRPWGPEDRFPESARAEIVERLAFEVDDAEAFIEFEIWPTLNADKRTEWRTQTEGKIAELGGRIVHRSSISLDGFSYQALLAGLSVGAVRALIANPSDVNGLAAIDGVQFILPQTVAQAVPAAEDDGEATLDFVDEFDPEAPVRAVLIDGTPVAAHPALDGGIEIEDIHDLVRLSQVKDRYHATSMASLILRGDLEADGTPLTDARIISVPVLVDDAGSTHSPQDRLFVDVLHTTLARLFIGEESYAPQAFVVNLSIAVGHMRFGGKISALARLLDWWSSNEGVLFVVSAGNISDHFVLRGVIAGRFEDASFSDKQAEVRRSWRECAFERTLLAPAEAMNALTIGAVSEDLSVNGALREIGGVMRLEADGEQIPQITSALGLGPLKSIKPDVLRSGGAHEVRALPAADDTRLSVIDTAVRTGLVTASPQAGRHGPVTRSRGTSCAAALTTRSILQCAEALVIENGPYQGQELPRQDLALLTRALAVNASHWPESADIFLNEAIVRLGRWKSAAAKEEVARFFGHGVLSPERMIVSPETGVTLVGLGNVRKDEGKIFQLPLPQSLAGERVPRSMRVTLSWFSPVDPVQAAYRLAGLEAIAADVETDEKDDGFGLALKGTGPDANMVKRGTVWSRRLVHKKLEAPDFDEDEVVPIRVQCRDTSGGGLSPDDQIRFAIAVTLEVEAEVQYDVHQEVRERIAILLRGRR